MGQPEQSAELILKVAQDRDASAFAQLFDYYAPRLKGYLIKQRTEEALAEEIVQDVMMTLWHKAQLFDPSKSSPSTWIYRVARNRKIDLLRKKRDRELDPEEEMLQPASVPDVSVELDAKQRDKQVRIALQKLPAEQMEMVRLSFFTGLSHSEIAEKTGLPIGTVKSRIRLAFGHLKKHFEADDKIDMGTDIDLE